MVVDMCHVGTAKQWSDFLTKNTGRNVFCYHRHNTSVVELTESMLTHGLVQSMLPRLR